MFPSLGRTHAQTHARTHARMYVCIPVSPFGPKGPNRPRPWCLTYPVPHTHMKKDKKVEKDRNALFGERITLCYVRGRCIILWYVRTKFDFGEPPIGNDSPGKSSWCRESFIFALSRNLKIHLNFKGTS